MERSGLGPRSCSRGGWGAFLPTLCTDCLLCARAMEAHCAPCPRCAKSQLFSTTGSYGYQGPEFCTLQTLLVHQGFFF